MLHCLKTLYPSGKQQEYKILDFHILNTTVNSERTEGMLKKGVLNTSPILPVEIMVMLFMFLFSGNGHKFVYMLYKMSLYLYTLPYLKFPGLSCLDYEAIAVLFPYVILLYG